MVIFASPKQLEVGKILSKETDKTFNGFYLENSKEYCEPQPFFIIKQATREEWIKYCEEYYGICYNPNIDYDYFYEVSVD